MDQQIISPHQLRMKHPGGPTLHVSELWTEGWEGPRSWSHSDDPTKRTRTLRTKLGDPAKAGEASHPTAMPTPRQRPKNHERSPASPRAKLNLVLNLIEYWFCMTEPSQMMSLTCREGSHTVRFSLWRSVVFLVSTLAAPAVAATVFGYRLLCSPPST